MAYCPATLQPCIDDLCYGSGCLKAGGHVMLMHCSGCSQLIGVDGTDPDDACECEPVCYDDDDDTLDMEF